MLSEGTASRLLGSWFCRPQGMVLPRSSQAQKAQGQEIWGHFGRPVKISEPPPLGPMSVPPKLHPFLEPRWLQCCAQREPVATLPTSLSPAELEAWLPASPQAPREATQPTRAGEAPIMALIC